MFLRLPDGRTVLSRRIAELDRLVACVSSGRGGSLVLRGAAGSGKTTLLETAVDGAPECRIIRLSGVEPEKGLGLAAIHRLCEQLADGLDYLPDPQAQALMCAFGAPADRVPEVLLLGLAVRSLLVHAAESRPAICVVDDADRLDRPSARTLAFVARRIDKLPVGVVFAARKRVAELDGLADVEVKGLSTAEARLVVDRLVPGALDEEVRSRMIAELAGSPVGFVDQLGRARPGSFAGGFGTPWALSVPEAMEETFLDRLDQLSERALQPLLVAAAEPRGRPELLWRATEVLGVPATAVERAAAEGWLQLGEVVRFTHPAMRSAVYRAATPAQRRLAHLALAQVIDAHADPDLHAWHRGEATADPDAEVADALRRGADRARIRGGYGAEAAVLGRAAALTPDAGDRSQRLLAAAQAKVAAGAYEDARTLFHQVDPHRLEPEQRGLLAQLRAQTARDAEFGDELDILGSAVPMLEDAPRAIEASGDERSLSLGAAVALKFRDDHKSRALATRARDLALREGALTPSLQRSLATLAVLAVHRGDFTSADDLIDRAAIIGTCPMLPSIQRAPLLLAALRGRQPEATALLDAARAHAATNHDEHLVALAEEMTAVLQNGLGNYRAALIAAQRASRRDLPGVSDGALAELVEAAIHCGESELAGSAVRRLREGTGQAGTDWALGVEAYAQALVSDGVEADGLYRTAIERLRRCSVTTALARTHLVYGEWLRREGSRGEARHQLRAALDAFTDMGAHAFADRARRELLATGERLPRRDTAAPEQLTPQEARISRLARDGHSNSQIAAKLFISPRTVEYHLTKVFTKLGVTSRNQLHLVLPSSPSVEQALESASH